MLDSINFFLLKAFFRKAIPFLLLSLFIISRFTFFPVFHLNAFFDGFLYAFLFSWSVVRPQDLGLISCFLLGIFYDILSSNLLGMIAMIFISYRFLAGWKHARYVKASFADIWQYYIMISLFINFFVYAVQSIVYGQFLEFSSFLYELLIICLIFPLSFYLVQKLLYFLSLREM